LKAAIRDPSPVVFLENEILYGQSFDVPDLPDFILPIGRARVARAGRHVTIVSFSRGVAYALDAAKRLAEEGIEAEVIDLRTLRPLDIETVLASVRRTNRLVTVEEGWPVGSIGSEICARVAADAFDYLDAPPFKITGADVPMPYAANLEKLALPSVDQAIAAVKSVCYRT
jgi:pyruvate dehydrogenase E1 component beta subunit